MCILIVGTVGYWFITDGQYSMLDALYMTVITITTVGFGEIIDLAGNPAGRAFTMCIAFSGIGVLLYVVTNITGLVVEGELTQSFRRRKMEKLASKYEGHYIICGIGGVGFHIINELSATRRPYVIVDTNRNHLEKNLETFDDEVFIEGDATDDSVLLKAGIEKARGLFAVTGDDNQNLVIMLTAKQLNPEVRLVARCNEARNSEKMRKSGADAVVSPGYVGGLRMASEMIRPAVVTFLDTMLRDREQCLRVEEVAVPESFVGKALSMLNLKKYPNVLLLAVRANGDWVYNPAEDYVIKEENTLVFMTTPEERSKLGKLFLAD
ncbi:potassium channel family protein [Chloroflexota bacterium]